LVLKGVPNATIVIAKDASQSAKLAAKEFNYHIVKVTGIKLPEKTDNNISDLKMLKGTAVLIGESKFTRRLGLQSADFKRQEYLIRATPGMLILLGRDKPGTGEITYEQDGLFSGFKTIEGFGYWFPVEETGSCYAVYDFLERYCGIRWYLPADIGMVAPRKQTLAFSKINIRRRPWTSYRNVWPSDIVTTLYYWDKSKEVPPPLAKRDRNLWFLRMRMGGNAFAANHSTEDWPLRFLKKHPEYFADHCKDKGKLKARPNMLLCYSNPEVLEQVVKDARDYFDGNLTSQTSTISRAGDFFGVVPADTYMEAQCPDCNPNITHSNDYFNSNEASNYIFNFVNAVAKEVKISHPGKYISTLAYDGYFFPPDFALESNIAVMICLQSQLWWNPKLKENDKRGLLAWFKKSRDLYIWEYFNFPQHRKGTLFPGFSVHRLAKNIKLYHKLGIKGMFIELDGTKTGLWANPIQDQINVYFTLKLLDDPAQNVDKLLDEFYSSFYGKAGKAIKGFVARAEDIYNDTKLYPAWSLKQMTHLNEELSWKYLCLPETLKEFNALMKEAYKLPETELEKNRVRLFDEAVFQMMKKSSKTFISRKR